ncbi:MAG TPA: polysaccharide deacetylase family protein [Pyrinomonadaceae bacterium]|nr:polysaccharide deacetylase family protein [Pyrinomonadaceae bacterium]
MRPLVTLAKIATSATWAATRPDRFQGHLVPPVLCYHRVLPEAAGAQEPADYSVTPQQFEAQMALLKDEGFTSLTLSEYFDAARGLRELAPRSVLVTFDDGFADNYLVAWPIARRFDVTINLFICTGLVAGERVASFAEDNPAAGLSRKGFPEHWQPLSWEQLREMSDGGVEIGFHSHRHPNLGRMTEDEIALDAAEGISSFRQQLEREPEYFAFPFGHYGSYPKRAIDVLTRHGIKLFFTTELGRTPLDGAGGLVSRIVIHPEDDLKSFRRKLFGGYDWVGKLRRSGYLLRDSYLNSTRKLSRA